MHPVLYFPGSASRGGGGVVAGSRTAKQCVSMGTFQIMGHFACNYNHILGAPQIQGEQKLTWAFKHPPRAMDA